MKNLIFIFLAFGLTMACNSSKKSTTSDNSTVNSRTSSDTRTRNGQGRRGGPPSVDEIFKMDTNGDGMLAKSEVKGRLLENFSNVDTNGDGLLTRAEVENMPKPQRGQRPQRQ